MPYVNTKVALKEKQRKSRGAEKTVLRESDVTAGTSNGIMRVFNYLPCPPAEEGGKETLGSAPHTDWGLLTLILQVRSRLCEEPRCADR